MAEQKYRRTTNHGLGWRKDPIDKRDFLFTLPKVPLPASFSLRDKLPGIYDQGPLGSCTSNATCMAYRVELARLGLPDFQPSRLWHYFEERKLEGDTADDTGAFPRDGMKVCLHEGLPPETDWPYDVSRFAQTPPAKTYIDDRPHKISAYHAIPRTLTAMKTALVQGHAFTCGIVAYESLESRAVEKSGDVPMPKRGEQELGGHDILIIGYRQKDKVFEFANSWGDWGDNGCGTIPYAYLQSVALSSDRWMLTCQPPS